MGEKREDKALSKSQQSGTKGTDSASDGMSMEISTAESRDILSSTGGGLATALEKARIALLDLSRRNRLIHLRDRNRTAMFIEDEKPSEVFRILVDDGAAMQFLPSEKAKARTGETAPEDNAPGDNDSPAADESTVGPDLESAPVDEADAAHGGALTADASVEENAIDENGGHLPESDEATAVEEESESPVEANSADEAPASVRPMPHHVDRYLQTGLSGKKLDDKLLLLSREAQSAAEEQGTHLLFIALGFLEWQDPSQPENAMCSPLVLVPVDLERRNILSPFRLCYNGDDIQTNLCLEKKLTDEFGLRFPAEFKVESRDDFDTYVNSIRDQIADRTAWKITDRIALGLFTFTKFLMYRDLDPAAWKPASRLLDHPLLQALLNGGRWSSRPDNPEQPQKPAAEPVDASEKLFAREIGAEFLVLDADASQREAVKAVNEGANLIIQGPPGTGKSQTITNLIAESLGNGKKVLFVSEKRAALEVVKNRLDGVGLGDFSLELHSRDSSKRGFLDSLQRTLTGPRPTTPRDGQDSRHYLSTLQTLRSVGDDLLNPIGNTGLSPYYLMGKCLSYRDGDYPRVEMELSIYDEPNTLEECRRLTEEYANSLRKVGYPAEHVFADVETTDLLPNEVEESRFIFQELTQHFRELRRAASEVCSRLQIRQPDTIGHTALLADLWARLQDCPFSTAVDLESIDWSLSRETLETFSRAWQAYLQRYHKLSEFYIPSAIPWNDLDRHRQVIEKSSGSLFRFLNSEYKQSCAAIRDCLKSKSSMSGNDLLKAIAFLKESMDEKKAFESVEPMAPYIVGTVWKGIETPESVVAPRVDWVLKTRPVMDAALIDGLKLASLLTAARDQWQGSAQFVEDLEKALANCEASIGSMDQILHTPRLRWKRIQGMSLEAMESKYRAMSEETDALWDWVEFRRSQHLLQETPAQPIDQLAMEGKVDESNAVDTLLSNYYRKLLDQAFHERPELAGFRKDKLETAITNFQNLDQKMIFHARQRLAYELGQKTPRVIEGLSGTSSELGVIQREIHKKRRIKPIRRMLEEAGSLIQRIKPCFMMSPLSVAQFLPPGAVEFDIVIFDEASQMKPEDALGAIARGRQLIVVGDSKQLPPTRFFSRLESEDTDWEEEDESLSDLESILDACGATGMISRTLSWHYRSKHDSLIATSNREFYENRLTIFPSPFERNDRLGLQFIRIQDGLFQRGKGSINPKEATEVAQAVIDHARTRPNDSLGVGTFSIRQQAVILDEIDRLRREAADPALERFFASDREEPFFVKNLENIQGDERDVIFLSVCYARHDPDKPMAMNFGPLNQEGGERRLNVLITRAKKKCVVFSSISADEIDLDRTDARGVKSLKAFLHFAEFGGRDFVEDTINDEAAPLEARIHERLHKMGYQVVRQVGTGVFRLNFGIRHPENPSQFVLGLECDGAAYLSAPGSRERERTRPTVLGLMGWKLHRIWSTEYYRNPDRTIAQILKLVQTTAESTTPGRQENITQPEFDGIEVADGEESTGLIELASPYVVFEGPMPKTGRTLAKEIVVFEGPIHEDHLLERLKELLEVPRLTAKARAELENHVLAALRDKVILRLEEEPSFYVAKNFSPASMEPRHRSATSPDPAWISDIEILAAAHRIFEVTGEIPLDELMKNISLLLGYRSLTTRIQSRLEDALSRNNLRRIALKMDHRKRISRSPEPDAVSIFPAGSKGTV